MMPCVNDDVNCLHKYLGYGYHDKTTSNINKKKFLMGITCELQYHGNERREITFT